MYLSVLDPWKGLAPVLKGRTADSAVHQPFLRIPPFPRHRGAEISWHGGGEARACDPDSLIAAIRSERVGGAFWGARPELPEDAMVMVPTSGVEASAMLADATCTAGGRPLFLLGDWPTVRAADVTVLTEDCDPWHIATMAGELRVAADHELALVAGLARANLRLAGPGRFESLSDGGAESLRAIVGEQLIDGTGYRDPFSGEPMSALDAVALLGNWRSLIDSNRTYQARFGIAGWKRTTVDALLWGGHAMAAASSSRGVARLREGDRVVLWRSRTQPKVQEQILQRGVAMSEVEDGFIRSAGLGADCVPPLSIIVDDEGIYFDPARPSLLEKLIESGSFSDDIVARAKRIRESLVAEGLSKYARSTDRYPRPLAAGKVVLVTGQVEDDRSILTGGAGLTNLELLRRARQCEPDAFIIYKPHPDVEAGHRKGRIDDASALALADKVERDAPIAALLQAADAVHVITSQTGFEALMREKDVTVHGVPFYAGWGLTRDLGPVPPRRTARRTIDELVAAALIQYPRYLDPVTRLPCPPEVLIQRLVENRGHVGSSLVYLRRVQGALRRYLAQFTARFG